MASCEDLHGQRRKLWRWLSLTFLPLWDAVLGRPPCGPHKKAPWSVRVPLWLVWAAHMKLTKGKWAVPCFLLDTEKIPCVNTDQLLTLRRREWRFWKNISTTGPRLRCCSVFTSLPSVQGRRTQSCVLSVYCLKGKNRPDEWNKAAAVGFNFHGRIKTTKPFFLVIVFFKFLFSNCKTI